MGDQVYEGGRLRQVDRKMQRQPRHFGSEEDIARLTASEGFVPRKSNLNTTSNIALASQTMQHNVNARSLRTSSTRGTKKD